MVAGPGSAVAAAAAAASRVSAAAGTTPTATPLAAAAPAALVLGAARLVCGQALNDAVTGQHAAIDGEVAAHHEGSHGRVLLRQRVRGVGQVRLVLPPVDQDQTRVARVAAGAFVPRVCPSTSSAKAYFGGRGELANRFPDLGNALEHKMAKKATATRPENQFLVCPMSWLGASPFFSLFFFFLFFSLHAWVVAPTPCRSWRAKEYAERMT